MGAREVRQGMILLGVLVVSRAVILTALTLATGGNEFTSDAAMHLTSASDPSYILFGTSAENAHFPPLMPFAISVFVSPWRLILSDFAALRAGFATMEVVAWPLIWTLLVRVIADSRWRILMGLMFIVAPITWVSSIIMAQEEPMHLAIAAGICHLVLSRRWVAASVLCGFGVVTAKVFFAVPVFVIPLLAGAGAHRRTIMYWIAAASPIVVFYAIGGFFWWKNDLGFPLADFHPIIGPTQSVWLLLHEWFGLSVNAARRGSTLLSAALILGISGVLYLRRPRVTPPEINASWCLVATTVLCAFYMTMAEYFLMVLPALIFAMSKRAFLFVSFVVLSLPWAVNFFYGVEFAQTRGGVAADSVFVRLYQMIFFWVDAGVLKELSLAVFVVLSWGTCVMMLIRLLRPGSIEVMQAESTR